MIRGMFLSSTEDPMEIRLSRGDDKIRLEIDFKDGEGVDTFLMTPEFADALGEALVTAAKDVASRVNPDPEPESHPYRVLLRCMNDWQQSESIPGRFRTREEALQAITNLGGTGLTYAVSKDGKRPEPEPEPEPGWVVEPEPGPASARWFESQPGWVVEYHSVDGTWKRSKLCRWVYTDPGAAQNDINRFTSGLLEHRIRPAVEEDRT